MKIGVSVTRHLLLNDGRKNGRPESPADGLKNPCGYTCMGNLVSLKSIISGHHNCNKQTTEPCSSNQQGDSQKNQVRICTGKSNNAMKVQKRPLNTILLKEASKEFQESIYNRG